MKRKAIPVAIKRAVLARSGGMCEADSCDNVGKEFEHRIPVALGGDNTLENIWLACRACHREKTSNEDMPRIAKAERQAGRKGQYARRKRKKASGKYRPIPSPTNPWPPKGSRKLQSRGFGA